MQVTVKGKQVDVGEALRTHVTENLTNAVSKYFGRPIEATLTLSRDAHLFRADIIVHVSKQLIVQSQASANDPYPACDAAIEHAAKRIRRYKRRIKDDHHRQEAEFVTAPYTILAPIEEQAEAETEPHGAAVIAEMQTDISTLAVSDAVMRLDLGDLPVLMFRHATHGGLNVVYRRADGNIGWIDPHGNETAALKPAAAAQ